MKIRWGQGRKRTWTKTLQDLDLPYPRTAETFLHEYVRQVRGNRLVINRDPEVASADGPSGLWVPSEGVDLVWVHPSATGMQYDHVLGHEAGHMVNGDEPDPISLTTLTRLLQSMCKHTAPSLWESSLCRMDTDEAREQSAEEFSYFSEEWLQRTRPASDSLMLSNMMECLDTRM